MDPFATPQPQSSPAFDLQAPAPAVAPQPALASDPRAQIVDRLKGSVNVLVTVSNNPSVDQLAAAIGFTLVLNKLKKHGTALFSGQVPSTLEFLQPDQTLEKNTDSLRDFIVALDKAKADKLRYKIEDKYVKIFITPYHTSLTEKDLEFGQGDLNVDVIIALGVDRKGELDQALTAHGRILHDATIISITKHPGEDIGSINWHVPEASSFSEVLVDLSDALKSPQTELFDQQIATAFLTGIVAETARFSNEKTTPQTMTTSAILMRAGANQQLIATKLEEPEPIPEMTVSGDVGQLPISQMPVMPSLSSMTPPPPAPPVSVDGSMLVPHEAGEEPKPDIHIDENGMFHIPEVPSEPPAPSTSSGQPPMPPGQTLEQLENIVRHKDQTLKEIEQAVNSPHLTNPADDSMAHLSEDEARQRVDAIEKAAEVGIVPSENPAAPIVALNAVPIDLDMGHGDQPQPIPASPADQVPPVGPTVIPPAPPDSMSQQPPAWNPPPAL